MINDSNESELELIEEKGHLRIYKNTHTGKEVVVHAIRSDEFPQKDVIEEYTVKIVWRNDISLNKQIVALRKICPSLNNFSTSELFSIAKTSKEWIVGEFVRWRSLEILKSGKKLGLNIIIEGLSSE